ncbi:matrixin family metalloprotease [Kordia sp.]|uniref:matrixin family metalloprotease n=1 Tax=Kordia sp. TaxID=1965332 RepID=UPI003D6B268A
MKQKYLLLFTLFISLHFQAQECNSLMKPVSMQERTNEATLIVEGKVISSESYWDTPHQNIYTIHEISVYKNAKGTTARTIFIETQGGQVDNQLQEVSSTANLKNGYEGVFFLKNSNHTFNIQQTTYTMVAAAQGYIKYDRATNKAFGVFDRYQSIADDLYPTLEQATNKRMAIIQERPTTPIMNVLMVAPTISSFAPTTITAGTKSTLTISGTDFGTTTGQVLFSRANDGGATHVAALDSQIIMWSNESIVVEVPHTAGTGTIQVMNADGTTTSTDTLTIPYSHTNAISTSNVAYPTTIETTNGSFAFTYHDDFNTSDAKPYFEEAFDLWNCESGINFEFGDTTAVDVVADDGINIVRFDNGSELPTGVLGQVVTRSTNICSGTGNAFAREMDITWNDDIYFYYGDGIPNPSQYDFKSVALHELGHTHQLAHVINTDNIMHYNLGPGVSKFVLFADDIDAANYTMSVFSAPQQCSRMTDNNKCIYVPDDNFEAYLESNGMGNGVANDDIVTKTNISGVTTLDVSNLNISDLTGIQSFTSLQSLNCSNNLFMSVDLSKNSLLETLHIEDGALTDLDISQNNALINLYCQNNNLTAIDLIHNGVLVNLDCFGNNLTLLNVTQNVNLLALNCSNNGISSINLTQNTVLENLNFSQNNLPNLDVTQCPNLAYLIADNNNLTSVNITINTALKELSIPDNQITTLDLVPNTILEKVNANNNNLDFLNIANGNNAIIEFTATGNPALTCINVDNETEDYMATWLKDTEATFSAHCYETYVPDANFENYLENNGMGNGIANDMYVTTANIDIIIDLDVKNLSISDLTGIEGFKALRILNAKTNTLSAINLSSNLNLTSVDVSSNNLVSLDLTANTNLTNIDAEFNDLTSIDITGLTALLTLDYEGNNITNIDVTTNIALTEIRGDDNTIGTIDLSNNPALKTLRLENAGLNSIDLSNNLVIRTIRIGNNNLTSIDVSGNPEIYSFHVSNNQLTFLDIKNGNNTNIPPIFFNATGNPNLECINVDNVAFSQGNWPFKDNASSYGENCYETTYVPDDNFEDYLESNNMGNGISNDDLVLTSKIETVTTLNIPYQNIADLTGIEDFTALQSLYCYNNNLTSLDVSQNLLLEELDCVENQITSLDLSQNTALEYVFCQTNALTSLNAANGTNMNIVNFEIYENPNLTCVVVDDATYSTSFWTNKDDQTVYNDVSCDVQISSKVFLQGAALNPNTGEETLMRDDLRVAGMLPTTSPYSDNATCDAIVFNSTGADAIVDWVFVELRDATINTAIKARQSALLQRDGDVVAVDGISNLNFNVPSGNYYITIKHRNHLGIMTANTITLTSVTTSVDFTNTSNPITFGSNSQTTFGMPSGIVAMWTGNTNEDIAIQYVGGIADAPTILATVLNDAGNFLNLPTYSVVGYKIDDANMDGNSQYSGTNPDTPFILQNVLAHPGNFLNFSTYQIIEQLPENFNN